MPVALVDKLFFADGGGQECRAGLTLAAPECKQETLASFLQVVVVQSGQSEDSPLNCMGYLYN
jgi:hypothetical protein